jgi:phage gp45-like
MFKVFSDADASACAQAIFKAKTSHVAKYGPVSELKTGSDADVARVSGAAQLGPASL